jgi:hypothetical protein
MSLLYSIRQINAARTAEVASVLRAPEPPPSPPSLLERMRPATPSKPSEAERIFRLPKWSMDEYLDLDLSDRYKKPEGTMRLRNIQSIALHWIEQTKGGFLPLAVGSGKTLVSLLASRAVGAKRPFLLVPAPMVVPLFRELERLKPHWNIDMNLSIFPYSQLSLAKNTDFLERLRPDLIIADESHLLRNNSASRVKRFLRYFQSYPETKFVCMSGTMTSKSLRDYAHLAELALRENTPVPREAAELLAWSNCLDANADPRWQDWTLFARFHDVRGTGGTEDMRRQARKVFRERLTSTPGVVATREGSVECSLTFQPQNISVPTAVTEALDDLRRTWTRPDGEEIISAIDLWRHGLEMSAGFYYRWAWPGGIVDWEWMNARSAWRRQVREILQHNVTGLDSPLLVWRGVHDGHVTDPEVQQAFHAWEAVRARPKPPVETVWLSDYLIRAAVDWATEHPHGLVWYEHQAVGQALKKAGLETYGAGETPPDDGRGMALSIRSHGTGLNLQKSSENLVLTWPSSGKTCEQLIGRTHRFGQTADLVSMDYFAPTDEVLRAVDASRTDARYIEETQGSPQKLNYGTWL